MENGKCICLFICVMLQLVTVDLVNAMDVEIDNIKCGNTYTVDNDDYGSYMVSWDGRAVTNGCNLIFKAKDGNYKVCTMTMTHVMPNCQPKIQFYNGDDVDFEQELHCGTVVVNKECSKYGEKITLIFRDADTTTASNVTIKVYGMNIDDGDDDDNYLYLIRPIASGAGVVLFLIATAVGWCIFLKISRKRELQRKEMMAVNKPLGWGEQAQAQAQTQGYTYNTQQSYMYPVGPQGGVSNPVEKI